MAEALVIVDFQNDFTPGGALAVPHGDEIAPRIAELLDSGRFELVVATRDWHPPEHRSFDTAHPPGIWPPHCVQGTPGAELHDALPRERIDLVVDKGQAPDDEGYSAFERTGLGDQLRERGIDRITVVGLATDYCVKNTALGGLREGFEVELDRKAVRGIDVSPGDVDRAIAEVTAAGGQIT